MLDLPATTMSKGLDAEALYGRSGEITFFLLLAAMRDGFKSPRVAAGVPELGVVMYATLLFPNSIHNFGS